jgi:hypothetical protein
LADAEAPLHFECPDSNGRSKDDLERAPKDDLGG